MKTCKTCKHYGTCTDASMPCRKCWNSSYNNGDESIYTERWEPKEVEDEQKEV